MGVLARRIVGWVLLVLAVLLLVLFVLGTWNPADLVVFWRYGRNPVLGAVIVFGLFFVASWLVMPVTNEAAQPWRARVRITLGLLLLVSLIGYGLFGTWFVPDYRIVATSPDGQRTIVMYDPGTTLQRLHVWAGTGLGRKYAGEIGYPCGPTVVTFEGTDTVLISTSYLDKRISLDHGTGRPQQVLGPSCSG
ncbi:hypothetical protein GCM10009557_72440 [Virgisporangium ochraceum]|uniref:Uncharacterized protein n=1 Tax=Virgisporangium ochraceum TaxID=65505 RepID=A0A8J3ZW46_9ACTN|nr:hypothetical protein [Virgisporangium ochraceum]GIJ69525.1 hypothetical protein Voc01_044420 [Virgisporangium ochraceum]